MDQDLHTEIALIQKVVAVIIRYLDKNTDYKPNILLMLAESFSEEEEEFIERKNARTSTMQ